MIGFLGRKLFMSYIYDKSGFYIPVTVINVFNCYIYDFKLFNNKFYAVFYYFFNNFFYQNNFHFFVKQFSINYFDFLYLKSYKKIPLNIFYINQRVNIFGISLGKGFSGVIKRHNFNSNYATHGNSKAHNKPGSIGMCQDPGRIYPGKKMPGRLGGKKKFLKNLILLKIDFDHNIFYLKGCVPGYKNSNILIYPF